MKPRSLGKAPPVPPPASQFRASCAQPVRLKVKCGGPVHRKTLETALGGDRLHELEWSTNYGPPILPTTIEMLWGTVFGLGGAGLAKLTDKDAFVELGCGQGGVLLAAHRSAPKCRVLGIEFDQTIVASARERLAAELPFMIGEQPPVTILCGTIDDYVSNGVSTAVTNEVRRVSPSIDIQEGLNPVFSLSEATVVYMFLSQYAMLRLRPKLLHALPVGARILCRRFTMGRNWQADEECYSADGQEVFRLYIVTPSQKEDPLLLSNDELEDEYALLRAGRPADSTF